MSGIKIKNWDQVFDLIGHTTIYLAVEEFMVKTLKIKKSPTANTIDDCFGDEIGVGFVFNLDPDVYPLTPPKDTLGNFYLNFISIERTYQGNMPFGLDFSMNSEEVLNEMKNQDQIQFLESDETSSTFYNSIFKISIIIVFENNIISHINIYPIDHFNVADYNLK